MSIFFFLFVSFSCLLTATGFSFFVFKLVWIRIGLKLKFEIVFRFRGQLLDAIDVNSNGQWACVITVASQWINSTANSSVKTMVTAQPAFSSSFPVRKTSRLWCISILHISTQQFQCISSRPSLSFLCYELTFLKIFTVWTLQCAIISHDYPLRAVWIENEQTLL